MCVQCFGCELTILYPEALLYGDNGPPDNRAGYSAILTARNTAATTLRSDCSVEPAFPTKCALRSRDIRHILCLQWCMDSLVTRHHIISETSPACPSDFFTCCRVDCFCEWESVCLSCSRCYNRRRRKSDKQSDRGSYQNVYDVVSHTPRVGESPPFRRTGFRKVRISLRGETVQRSSMLPCLYLCMTRLPMTEWSR